MKNEQETPKSGKGGRRGFYAALAICVLAIGIAAWSTYDTFSGYLAPVKETRTDGIQEAVVSPVPEDDPESRVPAGHGHSTAPAVKTETEPEQPEKAEPSAEPEAESKPVTAAPEAPAETEKAAEEAAAEPVIYTVSEHFLRPVSSGDILTPYTETPVYSETMRDYRVHLGADYAAERGETVKAAANGIVKDAYTDMLLGNILVIEHGGVEIRYCGLGETFLVKAGELVTAGQDIGSVTAAPFESAMDPHLHLEVIRNGEVIDPESLF